MMQIFAVHSSTLHIGVFSRLELRSFFMIFMWKHTAVSRVYHFNALWVFLSLLSSPLHFYFFSFWAALVVAHLFWFTAPHAKQSKCIRSPAISINIRPLKHRFHGYINALLLLVDIVIVAIDQCDMSAFHNYFNCSTTNGSLAYGRNKMEEAVLSHSPWWCDLKF